MYSAVVEGAGTRKIDNGPFRVSETNAPLEKVGAEILVAVSNHSAYFQRVKTGTDTEKLEIGNVEMNT